jgi:hypothetical protein
VIPEFGASAWIKWNKSKHGFLILRAVHMNNYWHIWKLGEKMENTIMHVFAMRMGWLTAGMTWRSARRISLQMLCAQMEVQLRRWRGSLAGIFQSV